MKRLSLFIGCFLVCNLSSRFVIDHMSECGREQKSRLFKGPKQNASSSHKACALTLNHVTNPPFFHGQLLRKGLFQAYPLMQSLLGPFRLPDHVPPLLGICVKLVADSPFMLSAAWAFSLSRSLARPPLARFSAHFYPRSARRRLTAISEAFAPSWLAHSHFRQGLFSLAPTHKVKRT